MKKLFVLILVVCMMMGVTAFAGQGETVQDELPPVVVAYTNADGETIVAKICDADGNVVAEIKDDGSLILTDVHARETAENTVIVTRLSSAYDGIMKGVHHSAVECRQHDHAIKVDIDAILQTIDTDMDAHDLVMYEMFDVMLSDEAAALLADGCYLELTLALVEDHEGLPLVAMYTTDGNEWDVMPTVMADEKTFTVQLPGCGTIALMNDGRKSIGIGEQVEYIVTEIPTEEAAEQETENETYNFTPSVSGKTAPEIVPLGEENGETYVAVIRNTAGDVDIKVPNRNYIIITAVSERDYNVDIQTHEHLEWSYDRILNAKNVGELFTEHDLSVEVPEEGHGTIAAELDNVLAQMGLTLTHEQLVVKDLFEVSAYGDYLKDLYNEDYYLEVTFDADLDPSKPVVVIHSADSKHWHVHPVEEYQVNEDGSITLKMYDLGVVAFLVEAEEELNPESAVQSPN